ncbi:ATP-binding protein [Zhihengliuella sp.]|uniref:ATP-binding protein n=1 Tax=Zhihengliuella sp. TaxID=1954483 RepID=UPI002811FFF7|nr:ATP-binding protein [Zhihengliuella sp.]
MGIEYTLPLGEAVNPGQHRLARIQVVNWGTFHGRHELYVDRSGTLLTGHPGVGKSTLFDGIGHIFHAVPRLNESAHEASSRRDRRTTYSYMRGRQFKTSDGVVAQRPGATWSAMALVYEDGLGGQTCIAALFDLPANGLEGQVGKHYAIGDRPLDTAALEDHGPRRFSPSSLSKALPGFDVYDTHKTFAERFRRRLGIDHDKAFSLLRTLQNGKGLDRGVNQFFRHEVLEVPGTLAAAAGAVEDFSHLRGIHRQLEEARAQRDALELVPAQYARYRELLAERTALGRAYDVVLPRVRAAQTAEVLGHETARLEGDLAARRTGIADAAAAKERLDERVRSLQEQHDAHGGQAVRTLERELEAARARLAEREKTVAKLIAEAEAAGVNLAWSASGLDAMRREAAVSGERLESIAADTRTLEYEAMAKVMAARDELRQLRADIESYRRRGSNIDDRSATARRTICSVTGLDPEQLPFGGELMDMAPDAGAWRPAAEKALRSLATTLLVPGEHLAAVTRAIDGGAVDSVPGMGRLRWVDVSVAPRSAEARPADLVTRLEFKEGAAGAWLRAKITADHAFVCVEDDAELHGHDRAISLAGTLKTGRGAFERDTRPLPASDYLLGFTNEEKIAQLEGEAAELESRRLEAEGVADERSRSTQDLAARVRALKALAGDTRDFAQLDAAPARAAVEELEARITDAMGASDDLASVREALDAARAELESTVGRLAVLRSDADALERAAARARRQLESAAATVPGAGSDRPGTTSDSAPSADSTGERSPEDTGDAEESTTAPVTEQEQAALLERFAALAEATDVAEVEAAASNAALVLTEELGRLRQRIFGAEAELSETFRQFARDFGPGAAASYGTGAEAAPQYVELYQSIVDEGLPQREDEFREYFSNRSYERFSDLLQLLEEERRAIAERIEPLNQILSDVPFEQGSRLRLELTTTVPDEARTFRAELKEALGNAYAPATDGAQLTARYEQLERLVDALDDPGRAAWRDTVLDVRRHVTIGCNEHKANGEVETGLEPGTLSGGEGQRFTSFIMGAALAYQLGLATQGFTTYGTVMIDEAFIQANSDYAAAGINALQEFGFQLLLAAPEDKVDLAKHLGSITDIVKHPASNVSGFVATGLSPAVATDIVLR